MSDYEIPAPDMCGFCEEPISGHSPTELAGCIADLRAQDDRTYYATTHAPAPDGKAGILMGQDDLDDLVYRDDPALCGDITCYSAACRKSALDAWEAANQVSLLTAFGLQGYMTADEIGARLRRTT